MERSKTWQQRQQALVAALTQDVPPAWHRTAVLSLRLDEEDGRHRCRQVLRGPGGATRMPGDALIEAIQAFVVTTVEDQQLFRQANFALGWTPAGWSTLVEFDEDAAPRSARFTALVERYALLAHAKEARLRAVVGGAQAQLGADRILRFAAANTSYPAGFLAAMNESTSTWSAGWALPLELNEAQRRDSQAALEYGCRHAVPELVAGLIPLDGRGAERYAAVAGAIAAASAVVRCKSPDGAVWASVHDADLDALHLGNGMLVAAGVLGLLRSDWVSPSEAADVVRAGLPAVDGKIASASATGWEIELGDGSSVSIELGEDGTIQKVRAAVHPEDPTTKRLQALRPSS